MTLDPIRPAFSPVDYAVPLFVITIVAEIILGRLRKAKAVYEVKDTATSLGMGIGSQVAGLLTVGIVGAVMGMKKPGLKDLPATLDDDAPLKVYLLEHAGVLHAP